MAQPKQTELFSLWEKASDKYKADLKKYDEEYQKKHNHIWNIHKHKIRQDGPPDLRNAHEFTQELARRQSEFKEMRMKNHGIFKAMSSLATPISVIGGQAAEIGGLVRIQASEYLCGR